MEKNYFLVSIYEGTTDRIERGMIPRAKRRALYFLRIFRVKQ